MPLRFAHLYLSDSYRTCYLLRYCCVFTAYYVSCYASYCSVKSTCATYFRYSSALVLRKASSLSGSQFLASFSVMNAITRLLCYSATTYCTCPKACCTTFHFVWSLMTLRIKHFANSTDLSCSPIYRYFCSIVRPSGVLCSVCMLTTGRLCFGLRPLLCSRVPRRALCCCAPFVTHCVMSSILSELRPRSTSRARPRRCSAIFIWIQVWIRLLAYATCIFFVSITPMECLSFSYRYSHNIGRDINFCLSLLILVFCVPNGPRVCGIQRFVYFFSL